MDRTYKMTRLVENQFIFGDNDVFDQEWNISAEYWDFLSEILAVKPAQK